MNEGHLRRVVREVGGEAVLHALAEGLSPTDLQSLLLEVYRRRASRISAADVLRQYRESRFVRPAVADARALLELERLAYKSAVGFEPVELSPLCPLGTVSLLGDVSPNWVVPTVRNTEVVADPTNCLALECAVRQRAGSDVVRLCAAHRVVRTQMFEGPLSFAHFALFGLCTAGRSAGSAVFEVSALREHLAVHVGLLSSLPAVSEVRVVLTAWDPGEELLLSDLAFPGVSVSFDAERARGRGYYDRFCFEVLVRDASGAEHSVCDGGFTDWTAKLVGSAKERLLISGVGLERVCLLTGA